MNHQLMRALTDENDGTVMLLSRAATLYGCCCALCLLRKAEGVSCACLYLHLLRCTRGLGGGMPAKEKLARLVRCDNFLMPAQNILSENYKVVVSARTLRENLSVLSIAFHDRHPLNDLE